jgi:glycosidase
MMGAIHRFVAGTKMKNEYLLEGARNQTGLNAQEFAYHVQSLLNRVSWEIQLAQLNFVNTNDLARFITVTADPSSVELATILLFTLPGAPAILYGDEVGLEGGLPPDSRRGFPSAEKWNQSLLNFHKELSQLRYLYAPLRRGSYKTLHAERMLFLFERRFGDEMMLTAVNAGNEPDQIETNIPTHTKLQKVFGTGNLQRLPDQSFQLNVPPRSSVIFRIS